MLHRFLMLGLTTIPLLSQAWDITATANGSTEYESNQTRSGINGESGTNSTTGLAIGVEQDGQAISATANYDVRRRFNSGEANLEDETYATGEGAINWAVVNGVWNVYAENFRTLSTIDNRQANNPGNQQEIDETVGGSNITLPIGRQYLSVQAERTWTSREISNADSTMDSIALSYGINLSDIRTLWVVRQESEIDFDNPIATDYDNKTTSINFDTTSRIGEVFLSLGYTETELENSRTKIDGITGQFDLLRQLGDASTIQLNADRRVADNLSQRRQFFFFDDDLDLGFENTLGNQIYTQTVYTVTGSTVLGSNQVTGVLQNSHREYEQGIDQDELRNNARISISRQLNAQSQASASASYTESEFDDAADDEAYRYSLGYSRDFTPRFSMGLRLGYVDRRSDQGNARDFDGWDVTVRFTYVLLEGNGGIGNARSRVRDFGSRR